MLLTIRTCGDETAQCQRQTEHSIDEGQGAWRQAIFPSWAQAPRRHVEIDEAGEGSDGRTAGDGWWNSFFVCPLSKPFLKENGPKGRRRMMDQVAL